MIVTSIHPGVTRDQITANTGWQCALQPISWRHQHRARASCRFFANCMRERLVPMEANSE